MKNKKAAGFCSGRLFVGSSTCVLRFREVKLN